jgi:Domain of unknown function (DUF6458)
MYIGTSIFLIALGAILAFAVTATVAGIDIQTAGWILMLAGGLGLLISAFWAVAMSDRRQRDEAVARRDDVTLDRERRAY